MKKFYYGVLTILSILVLALVTFYNINRLTNFVDTSEYNNIIMPIINYGPIILMCLFAFGGLFGKVLSKILFTLIVLLLIILIVSLVAPEFIQNIFNTKSTTQFLNLLIKGI